MKTLSINLICIVLLLTIPASHAQDKIELETTTIKGNKELPKILYVVPWQDKQSNRDQEQKLQLHSLFGNLFDPIVPDESNSAQ